MRLRWVIEASQYEALFNKLVNIPVFHVTYTCSNLAQNDVSIEGYIGAMIPIGEKLREGTGAS